MKKKSTHTTKSKFALRTTGIATAYATIKKSCSIYTFILGLIGSIAPFFTFLVPVDMPGAFGYPYMSSLLWSLAVPLMALGFGMLLHTLSLKTPEEYRLPYQLLSTIIICVGMFFLIFTFVPLKSSIPYAVHIGGLLLSSVAMTIALTRINKVMLKFDSRLERIIKKLFSFIINDVKDGNYIPPNKQTDYLMKTDKLIDDVSKMI